MADGNGRTKIISLAILISIFLFNDFLFMAVKGYRAWLLIDYGSRILALGLILYLITKKVSPLSEFGLVKIGLAQGVRWSVLLSVTGILIDQVGWRFFKMVLPATQLMSFPKISNIYINAFDLTVGIMLISFSEELIFRGYFYSIMKRYLQNPFLMVLLSSLVFGFIHWSMGLHAIASTALWGVLPMIVMQRTGSVVPALIAHYLTDLMSFSSIIPESWFYFIQ